MASMDLGSRKVAYITLAISALVCSKALFWSFHDPEGPNLLIVTVLAVIVFGLSLAVYVFVTPTRGPKSLLLAIAAQILIVAGLYVFFG